MLTLYITTMASLIGYQLFLEDPDFVDTWLQCFAVSTRTKKLKDDKEKGGKNVITDHFLATTGCEVIMKVSIMAYPTNLEDLTWKNKLDHKKKFEVQEKVGCGRKNGVHVDETRNWWTNHKISTPSMKCKLIFQVWKTWTRRINHWGGLNSIKVNCRYVQCITPI